LNVARNWESVDPSGTVCVRRCKMEVVMYIRMGREANKYEDCNDEKYSDEEEKEEEE
jgi:hypothetical protein